MNKECYIVEDLIPLYNEGLLQDETNCWLESHLQSCTHCKELVDLSQEPIQQEAIKSPINQDKMMRKIHYKLSLYQIIFIAISFVLAIKTSLLNDSFGFILTYTILGCLTYLFYRRFLLVITIAFLPNFIWSLIDTFPSENATLLGAVGGSIFLACIHLIFAIIGSVIGFLILKVKETGD